MIIKVNFAPEGSTTLDGFITDSGVEYSPEQGYGWVTQSSLDSESPIPIDISPNTRDRTSNSDFTGDTLIHLQYPTDLVSPLAAESIKTPSAWEYDIANGSYLVTVGVGDPDFVDSTHVVNVEGESLISNFVPTEDNLFAENTTLVEVTDGRLTIDAVGGENTKLTFVEIAPEDNAELPSGGGETDGDSEQEGDETLIDSEENSESQVTVGDFSIGFDASRINANNSNSSGFFVADNADTGAILFDVSNPGILSAINDELTLTQADLLLSPEFAAVLGDESLQGADVGDTRIDATLETQDNNTFDVESGVTSVFLDLPLLESVAGFQLAGVNSEAQPFSDDFQVGFNITEETDFTFSVAEGFTPIDGGIEHEGTVTFNTEVAAGDEDGDEEVETPVDAGNDDGDEEVETPVVDAGDDDGGEEVETPVDAGETVRVNFAPASAFSPEGYIQDIGGEYNNDRGFGWITEDSVGSDNPTPINISPNARDRNSVVEDTFDSLIHLQYGDAFENDNAIRTPSAWEYELANGEYTVTVSVGDPEFEDSNHVINIEGNSVIAGFVPTEDSLFTVRTSTVEVNDGRLTIDAIGGENTKLNFVEIAPSDGSEITDPPVNVTPIEIPTEVPIPVEGAGVVEMVEPIEGGINFNFGAATVDSPAGFTQDIGAAYNSDRGYGWVTQDSVGSDNPTPIDLFANARDRNTLFNNGQGGVFQEPVRDSLIHLQYPTGLGNSETAVVTAAAWEHAVENGRYEVTVGVGDPDFFDSEHTINVEGESAISGFIPTGSVENGFLPLDAQAFASGTVTVDVSDGRLTIDAIGGENTKINYVSIVPITDL